MSWRVGEGGYGFLEGDEGLRVFGENKNVCSRVSEKERMSEWELKWICVFLI